MLSSLQDSTYSSKSVIDKIRKNHIAWRSTTAVFYDLGNDVLAKVFNNYPSSLYALREFTTMIRIGTLKDRRIKMPSPITLLNLGSNHQLFDYGLESATHGTKIAPETYEVYSVLMRKINGENLDKISPEKKEKYKKSLLDLVDALVEHGIIKRDLKEEEIFCLNNSFDVAFVDANFITWGDASQLREFYLKIIR